MAARNLCKLNIKLYSRIILCNSYHTSNASYAKPAKAAGKIGQPAAKVVLETETDPQKLVTKCCGANIYIDGEDPDIKPDSEYPDWLWNLRISRTPPNLSELDPDSEYYWKRLRTMTLRRKNKLRKVERQKT
ncbi:hypothetical protein SNE40_004795 [Patella caerulea]|uniref:Large ribosomal subunit protein mL54 n=1 Tax=Patella caerulea TaxID=87958 RepID=A0AAN8K677_PATCE